MSGQLPIMVFLAVAAAIVGVGLLIYEWFFRHRDAVRRR
jgi:hypothetical protein